jgi:hypothetical protein
MLVALAALALAADTDLDGVDNLDDFCPGEDDTVDVDLDGQADCAQTLLWEFGMGTETDTLLAYEGQTLAETPARYLYDSDADLYGYASSGAIVFNQFSPGVYDAALEVDQCVALTPGESYVVGGTFEVEGQTSDTYIILGVLLHTQSDCAPISRYSPQGWLRLTTWSEWIHAPGDPMADHYHAFVAPAVAPYALVRLRVASSQSFGNVVANTSRMRATVDNLGLWNTDTIVVKSSDLPDPGTVGRSRAPDNDDPSDGRANDSDKASTTDAGG